jgi:nitrite reductase/ring-hydroxylating ferredoxin subunit
MTALRDCNDQNQRICHISDVADGQPRGFAHFGHREKVIVLRKNGQLHAYRDACPHYEGGTPMAWKSDAYLNGDGTYLACHSHGALFEMETGVCVAGPCLGQKLTRVEITVMAQGDVCAVI